MVWVIFVRFHSTSLHAKIKARLHSLPIECHSFRPQRKCSRQRARPASKNDLSETFPLAPRQIECFVEHSTGHKWSILFDGAPHINYIQQMNGKQRREIENVRTRECIERAHFPNNNMNFLYLFYIKHCWWLETSKWDMCLPYGLWIEHFCLFGVSVVRCTGASAIDAMITGTFFASHSWWEEIYHDETHKHCL